jgi:hypothetical protein
MSAYPSAMFDAVGGDSPVTTLTLYTDAFIVRGTILTRQRRVSDILNLAEDRFIVLSDVMTDEFGTRGETLRADFAQINLNAVLFAVADTRLDTPPELRTPKVAEQALISVPPFKVTGSIYLMPGRNLREALAELTGKFVPVTTATYWSDVLGEARQTAELVAVNHERAQILAPLVIVDPWAGLGAAGPGATAAPDAPDAPAKPAGDLAWPETDVPPASRPPAEPIG